MSDEINYKSNPLHGLSLKNLLIELEDHYGNEILFAYLNINCFKTNPSIDASVKFLKKTNWAREKVESFYLYRFKNLPKASRDQYEIPPRDRVIPIDHIAGEPQELSLEDAEVQREITAKKTAAFNSGSGRKFSPQHTPRYAGNRDNDDSRKSERKSSDSSNSGADTSSDAWANWRK